MIRFFTLFILSIFLATTAGCGYTRASLLPADTDSVHVANFKNEINPAGEVSDKRATYFYQPGLETNITRSVIDRFIFDGYLNIKSEKEADLLLKGSLIDLEQYPLSYSEGGGNVEEFRIEVIVNIELYDNKTGKLIWKEKNFMGRTSYDVIGPDAKTESQATLIAVKDLAQRIVEKTVEAW
ncbi:MAG: LPS assembly lipoprotein LptE [Candidatus Omnitrophota bacterium]